MGAADVGAVNRLGTLFHVHHPERDAVAAERQHLAPRWCFVLDDAGSLAGYCVAHPWGGPLPPGLDTMLGALPERPDCLHIHDLVITEGLRGRNLARPVLDHLDELARVHQIAAQTLIAVGTAGGFWRRQGFIADADQARTAFVQHSYGEDATPMRRGLSTPGAS